MTSFCHMLLATKSLKAQFKMGSLQSCLFIQHWFIPRVRSLEWSFNQTISKTGKVMTQLISNLIILVTKYCRCISQR